MYNKLCKRNPWCTSLQKEYLVVLERLSLVNKVAVVTGGGTGLGRAMSLSLARAGADVAIAGRRPQPLQDTAAAIQQLGRRSLAVPTDITVPGQVIHLMQEVLDTLGQVDILVNNAGIVRGQELKPVWEITDEEWRRGIDTNLSGAFYCVRAIAQHMAERGSGKIINVASGFAYRGQRNEYMYTSAKAALVNLTRSLALSLADHHIQVNCLVPGFFIVQPPDTPEGRERRQQQGRFLAIGRTGEPDELGPLVVFLASSASDHMTGQTVISDGGGLAAGLAPLSLAPTVPL
jgi:NAD(P)-dependent dehydrogenase (short-subunit alcohol dehydrogenase family)